MKAPKWKSKYPNSHLVIHLDINETILVGDEAGGDTREDSLNKMVAKSAFVQIPGIVENSKFDNKYDYEHTSLLEPTHWWDGTPIVAANNGGDETSCSASQPPPPLWTQWEWPTGCCPYYRTKYKSRSKTFLSHDGAIYKDLHNQLEQKLVWSEEKEKNHKNDCFEQHPVLAHLLPALFETLIALTASDQKFTIVFRTMGSDLQDIAQAVNLFAAGKHPHYPDFYSENLLLGADQMAKGKWKQIDEQDQEAVFQLWKDDAVFASGDAQVLKFIHSNTICGIVDDYPFWKQHDYAPWSGKPVWMPLDSHFHHCLFDDNIHNLLHDGIASIRKQRASDGSFHTLTSREILEQHGTHLIRVPTVEPVLNPRWFLEQLE